MSLNPQVIRPLGNNVLVEVLQEDLRRDSGLIIPENVKHPSCQGVIVAIREPNAYDLKPGDHVIFEHYQENQIFPDPADPTVEYLVMPETDIMVVLEGE